MQLGANRASGRIMHGPAEVELDLAAYLAAAVALAYDKRLSTRDVNAVFAPKVEVYRAAARVGPARSEQFGAVRQRLRRKAWTLLHSRHDGL